MWGSEVPRTKKLIAFENLNDDMSKRIFDRWWEVRDSYLKFYIHFDGYSVKLGSVDKMILEGTNLSVQVKLSSSIIIPRTYGIFNVQCYNKEQKPIGYSLSKYIIKPVCIFHERIENVCHWNLDDDKFTYVKIYKDDKHVGNIIEFYIFGEEVCLVGSFRGQEEFTISESVIEKDHMKIY